MTPEERARIVDNAYADLLLSAGIVDFVLEILATDEYTVNVINSLYSVVHAPIQQITEMTVLQLGYSVMPTCFGVISEASLEASGITRIRNIPNFNIRGQGVLIGIIDTGIDYTNPIFQYADGTTRIVSIWDQTIESENFPPRFNYGTVYTREQINEALQSEVPTDIVPSMDTNGHGTMVAGIAGGNEVPEEDFYGVAPDAEFVVVKLKQAKPYIREFFQVPPDAVCFQENDILFGLEYLLSEAYRIQRPMSICFALGTSKGAHDGRGVLSGYLSILGTAPGIALSVAAGNEGNARRHYFGTVNPALGYDTVELNVAEGEEGFSMELWGDSPSTFSIDITSPTGEYVPRIAASLDENREISFVFEQTLIYVDYQMVESQSGAQLILLRFVNPTPGIWRFNVYERGDLNLGFHIWLPMERFISDNTYFIESDPYTTLLSAGNSLIPITVTAYNTVDDSLYFNASRGFTRLGGIKPDIAAPGVEVLGPNLNQGFSTFTGTSVAAAHTAGVAAMLMEWGNVRGNLPGIGTIEMKKLMQRGARRNLEIEYPNRDWGYGILDVYQIFDSLRSGIII